MASTVTTQSAPASSGKRKLVYKQDPDGVFRLKKVMSDATSSALSILTKDDSTKITPLLQPGDELCDLSYKIVDTSHNHDHIHDQVIEHDNHSIVSSTSSSSSSFSQLPNRDQTNNNKKQAKPKKKKIKTNKSHSIKDTDSIQGSELAFPPVSPIPEEPFIQDQPQLDPPVTITPEISNSEQSIPQESNNEDIKNSPLTKVFNFLPISKIKAPFSIDLSKPNSMTDQRVVFFISGLFTALLLQKLAPTISYYAIIFLNLLKLSVLSGIVVGGICWYAGLIKLSNHAYLNDLFYNVKAKITGEPIPKPVSVPASAKTGTKSRASPRQVYDEEDDDDSDIDSDVSWPGMDNESSDEEVEEDENDYTQQPIFKPKIASPRSQIPEPRTRSSSPPKTTRKNTLSTIVPFVAPPRKMHSTHNIPQPSSKSIHQQQPKLSRIHTLEPLLRRDPNFNIDYDRRGSSATIDMAKGTVKNQDLRGHSPIRQISPHKKLPPNPGFSEDLPLINEIKLLRKEQAKDDDNLSELISNFGDVKRLNTTMSKNSVLGTRANYDKFLANAGRD